MSWPISNWVRRGWTRMTVVTRPLENGSVDRRMISTAVNGREFLCRSVVECKTSLRRGLICPFDRRGRWLMGSRVIIASGWMAEVSRGCAQIDLGRRQCLVTKTNGGCHSTIQSVRPFPCCTSFSAKSLPPVSLRNQGKD